MPREEAGCILGQNPGEARWKSGEDGWQEDLMKIGTQWIAAALLLAALGSQAAVQSGSDLSFDVASVKSIGTGPGREQLQSTPTSLTIRNVTLTFCIQWAYDVRRDQIMRPSWLNTEKYDIVAKAGGPSTEAQLRQMLQAMLAERFKLTFHRETKTIPVYEMVVGKGGPKLTESKSGDSVYPRVSRSSYDFVHASMSEFAVRLTELGASDLPVVDRTGLQGFLDISLKFPDGWRPRPRPYAFGAASIFTILEEQLGLKLELRKTPTEMLVIDHVEKPSEN